MGGTSSKVEPFARGPAEPLVASQGSSSKSDASRPAEAVGAQTEGTAAWPYPSVSAARDAGKSEDEIRAFLEEHNLQLAKDVPKKALKGGTAATTTATKEILRFPGAGVENDDSLPQLAENVISKELNSSSLSSRSRPAESPSSEKRASIRESPSVRRLIPTRKESSYSETSSVGDWLDEDDLGDRKSTEEGSNRKSSTASTGSVVADWLEEDDGEEIESWINDQHSTAEDVAVINKLIDEEGGNIKTLKYVRGRRASVAPATAMLPGGVEIPAALLALGGGSTGGGDKLDPKTKQSEGGAEAVKKGPSDDEIKKRIGRSNSKRGRSHALTKLKGVAHVVTYAESKAVEFIKKRRTSVLDSKRVEKSIDEEGHKVVNGYHYLKTLGEGSFGKVKLVEKNGKQFAIKIMKKSILKKKKMGGGLNNTAYNAVLREIAVMKKIHHENVVTLHEVIDDDMCNKLYLVIDFVQGGQIMDPENNYGEKLDPDLARSYLRDIVKGLEYLHFQKIIHQDIKPENLLVTSDGRVKISDFGVSRALLDDEEKLQQTEGTPAFQAPEIVEGVTREGQPADIWAVGITLYLMIYGKLPFMASSLMEIYRRIVEEEVAFSLEPQAPTDEEALQSLIKHMLDKDPQKRATLRDIMEHPWVTLNGTVPLEPTEYKIIEVTEKDASRAISTVDNLMMILKVRSKVKKLLKKARKTIVNEARTPTSVGSDSGAAPPMRKRTGSIDHHMHSVSTRAIKHVESCVGMSLHAHTDGDAHKHLIYNKKKKNVNVHKRRATISNTDIYERDLMRFMVKELSPANNADILMEQGIVDGQGAFAGRTFSMESVQMSARRSTDPGKSIKDYHFFKKKSREVKVVASAAKKFRNQLKRTDDFLMITKGFTVGGADGRSSQVGELSKETIVVNLQKSAATANGSAGSSHRKSFSVSPSLMSLPEGAGADDDSDSDYGLGEDDDIVGDGLDMIDNIFDQVVENSVPTDEEPLKSIVFPSIVHGLAHACNDNLKIASGSCQVQGKRNNQEDKYTTITDVASWISGSEGQGMEYIGIKPDDNCAFFGIYDGHNGQDAAEYTKDFYHRTLFLQPDFRSDKKKAHAHAFQDHDDNLLRMMRDKKLFSGCTCVTALVYMDEGAVNLFVAHAGDSMAIASRKGVAEIITKPHQCVDEDEKKRIEAAGGWVASKRLMGVLAVSRSFGDIEYKTLKEDAWHTEFSGDPLIPTPDTHHEVVDKDLEFIILATDGIWDVVLPQRAINIVRRELEEHGDVTQACNSLVSASFDGGSVDNITASIIVFNVQKRDSFAMRKTPSLESTGKDESFKILPQLKNVANQGHGINGYRRSAAAPSTH